jgi:hypothetical protein
MRCVIIRDDDTNAFTPVGCLERLYRPFLARGLPVNLAVVPEVRADARTPDGRREGFLPAASWLSRQPSAPKTRPAVVAAGVDPDPSATVPLAESPALVEYLHANPGYHVVQHGCHHDQMEFNTSSRAEVRRRIDRGARRLREAGFAAVPAFVAPHDKLSAVAYAEVARRFRVISTGWFEWRRVPLAWRFHYALRKLRRRPHWRVGRTWLLSHPGCLLSYQRPRETMLDTVREAIARQKITVLVTHWWEYFRDGEPDEGFIRVLHDTAEYLAAQPDVCVTSFDALAGQPCLEGPFGRAESLTEATV